MRLSEILAHQPDPQALPEVDGDPEVEVRGLSADSRTVEDGFLFAALPGTKADGRSYIADAVANGAVAVLAPPDVAAAGPELNATLLTDPNPRRRLALMAAAFYERQPETIAAVTGTNGKTSVASFTRQLWTALGHKAASLGTLGLEPERNGAPKSLTTPDPVDLHRCLAELASDGIDHLVMEASSHGLDQHRLDGVRIRTAAFTNLTRDHMDYHGSAAAYLSAKLRLFRELLEPGGTAVLNADVPQFSVVQAVCRARRIETLSFGHNPKADLRLEATAPHPSGQQIAFHLFGERHQVDAELVGTFQAANVLAALGLVIAGGADPAEAAAKLSLIKGVRGRMERAASHPNGAPIYVDFAHTPDALETALKAIRPHVKGLLLVVFGAGGDRDPGKRPLMGAAAAANADLAIVTDDNPRSEDPAEIRAQVLAGAPDAEEVGERRAAIEAAIRLLKPEDVLVIAGKGHEQGQIVGDRVLPFDDGYVARNVVSRLVLESRAPKNPGQSGQKGEKSA